MVTTSCYNCNNLMLGNIVVFKNDFSPKCASHLNYIDVCKYLMQCIHSIETPGEKAESKTESSNDELEPVSDPDQTGFSVTTSKIFFGLPVNQTEDDRNEIFFGLPVDLTLGAEPTTESSVGSFGPASISQATGGADSEQVTLPTQDLVQKIGESGAADSGADRDSNYRGDGQDLITTDNRKPNTDPAIKITTLSSQSVVGADQNQGSGFSQIFNLSTLGTLDSGGVKPQRPGQQLEPSSGSQAETSTFRFTILEAEEFTTMMSRVMADQDLINPEQKSDLQTTTPRIQNTVSDEEAQSRIESATADSSGQSQATTSRPASETGIEGNTANPSSSSGSDQELSFTTIQTTLGEGGSEQTVLQSEVDETKLRPAIGGNEDSEAPPTTVNSNIVESSSITDKEDQKSDVGDDERTATSSASSDDDSLNAESKQEEDETINLDITTAKTTPESTSVSQDLNSVDESLTGETKAATEAGLDQDQETDDEKPGAITPESSTSVSTKQQGSVNLTENQESTDQPEIASEQTKSSSAETTIIANLESSSENSDILNQPLETITPPDQQTELTPQLEGDDQEPEPAIKQSESGNDDATTVKFGLMKATSGSDNKGDDVQAIITSTEEPNPTTLRQTDDNGQRTEPSDINQASFSTPSPASESSQSLTTVKPLPVIDETSETPVTSRPAPDQPIITTTQASRGSNVDESTPLKTTPISTTTSATASPVSTTAKVEEDNRVFEDVPLINAVSKDHDSSNTFDTNESKKDDSRFSTTERDDLDDTLQQGGSGSGDLDSTKPPIESQFSSKETDLGSQDSFVDSSSAIPTKTGDDDLLVQSSSDQPMKDPQDPKSASDATSSSIVPPLRIDEGTPGSDLELVSSTTDQGLLTTSGTENVSVTEDVTAATISVLEITKPSVGDKNLAASVGDDDTSDNLGIENSTANIVEEVSAANDDDEESADTTNNKNANPISIFESSTISDQGVLESEEKVLQLGDNSSTDALLESSKDTNIGSLNATIDESKAEEMSSASQDETTQSTLLVKVPQPELAPSGEPVTTVATTASTTTTTPAAPEEGFLSSSLLERIRDILLTLAAGLMTQAISFPALPSRRGDVTESPTRVPQFPIIRDPSIRKKIQEENFSFKGNTLNFSIPLQPSDLDKLRDETLRKNLTNVASDAFRPVQDSVHDVGIIVDDNDEDGRIIFTAQRDDVEFEPQQQQPGAPETFGQFQPFEPTSSPEEPATSSEAFDQQFRVPSSTIIAPFNTDTTESTDQFNVRPRPSGQQEFVPDQSQIQNQNDRPEQGSGSRPVSTTTGRTPPFSTGSSAIPTQRPQQFNQPIGSTQRAFQTSTSSGGLNEVKFDIGDAITRPSLLSTTETSNLPEGPSTTRPTSSIGSGGVTITSSSSRTTQPPRNNVDRVTPGSISRTTTARGSPAPSGPTSTERISSSERSRINNKFNPELNYPPQLSGNGVSDVQDPNDVSNNISSAARPLPVLTTDEDFFGAVSSDDDDRFFDSRINILGGSSANIVQATVVEDLNFARSVRDSSIGIATISSITVGVIALLGFGLLIFLALARRRRMRRHGTSSMGSPMVTPTQSRTTFSGSPIMGGENTPSLSDTRAASFLDDQLNTSSSAGSSLDPVLPLDGHGTIVTSYDDYMSLPENLRSNIMSSLHGSGSGIGSALGTSSPPPPLSASESIPRTRNLPESSNFLFSRSPPSFNQYPV